MILFIILWSLWALISCALAITKKRNSILWFIIGFLLGPIGFIILAFLDNRESNNDLSKTKTCSYCAENIKHEAILCRFCNKEQSKLNKSIKISAAHEELHKAVWNGNYSEVVELINSGVDISQVNENGQTALMLAEQRNDTLICKLLKSNENT